jgi:C-terminal processing protease CtpA/Prc
VRAGSPAWRAGVVADAPILTIDGRKFSQTQLERALERAQRSGEPIVLKLDRPGTKVFYVNYRGGVRYPHLARIPGTPDMLAQISAPHATR